MSSETEQHFSEGAQRLHQSIGMMRPPGKCNGLLIRPQRLRDTVLLQKDVCNRHEMKRALDWQQMRARNIVGPLQEFQRAIQISQRPVDVREILQCDLRREMEAHPMYTAAISHCESVKDFVSRELLVHIQKSEEEHIDFIEEQLGLIDKMGLPNYVQSATGELTPGNSA